MKNNNDNNSKVFLAGMVIGVILAVVVGGCLIMSKTIKVEDKEETVVSDKMDDVTDQKDVNITEVTFNGEKILVSNITRETIYISSAGIEGINVKHFDYYIDLKESGKVYVRAVGQQESANSVHEGYLSNVSDVVDIVKLTLPALNDEQLIYILQTNGDVYYYRVGDGINGKYKATKVDDVSNIVKLFIYDYPLNGALGGTWSIVGIKDNGETVEIRKEGV